MALERGACGYLVKTVDPRDLAAALRLAIAESMFTHLGSDSPGPLDELSTKERTVLAALTASATAQVLTPPRYREASSGASLD